MAAQHRHRSAEYAEEDKTKEQKPEREFGRMRLKALLFPAFGLRERLHSHRTVVQRGAEAKRKARGRSAKILTENPMLVYCNSRIG